jgi:hypothetical protein
MCGGARNALQINVNITPRIFFTFCLTIRKEKTMLYTVAVVLLILWLLGLVTSYTLGGFIHILLVVAIIVVLLRVISGRKPL